MADRQDPRAPQPGDAAPPLELPTLDGGGWDLRDHRGEIAVVSFLRHGG